MLRGILLGRLHELSELSSGEEQARALKSITFGFKTSDLWHLMAALKDPELAEATVLEFFTDKVGAILPGFGADTEKKMLKRIFQAMDTASCQGPALSVLNRWYSLGGFYDPEFVLGQLESREMAEGSEGLHSGLISVVRNSIYSKIAA